LPKAFLTIEHNDLTKNTSSKEAIGNKNYRENHEDEIHVLSYTHKGHNKLDNDSNNLHLILGPLVIVKHLDKSSPLLMNEMTQGANIGTVSLDIYRDTMTSGREKYLNMTLHDTIIVDTKTFSDGTDTPKQEISFSYKDIEYSHLGALTFASTIAYTNNYIPDPTGIQHKPVLEKASFVANNNDRADISVAGIYSPISVKIDTSYVEAGAEGTIEVYDDNWGMPKTHILKEPVKFTVGGDSTVIPLELFRDPSDMIRFIKDDLDVEPMSPASSDFKELIRPRERMEGKDIELYAKVTIAGQTKTTKKLRVHRKLSTALQNAPKNKGIIIRAIRPLSLFSDLTEGDILGIENSGLLHEQLFLVDANTNIGLLGQDAGIGRDLIKHTNTNNIEPYVVKQILVDEKYIMQDIAHEVAMKKHDEFVATSTETLNKPHKNIDTNEFTEFLQVDYGMVGGYNCQAYIEEVVDIFNERKDLPPPKTQQEVEADEAMQKLSEKLDRMEKNR